MMNAPNRTKPTARRWTTAVLSLSGVAVVAACSSSGTTGASTPSAAASATHAAASGSASGLPCAQITALRSTLTDLTHTSVSITSAPRLTSDLAKADQQLTALKNAGTGTFSAQATQLSNALNAIKKDAAALAKSPTPTNISNLTSAVTNFKATAEPLIKEMQTACP